MHEVVLFLHFFGLMLGAAGGLGGGILMRKAAGLPPEQAQAIRAQGPMLANVSAIGLALLWITGIIMFFEFGGYVPATFWIKFALVVIATITTILIHLTYAEMRKNPGPALAKRLQLLGPATGLAVLLAVLFAVIAFN
jgi:hypothetical protein